MASETTIAITGATGFVGQALVRELAARRRNGLRLFSRRPGEIGGRRVAALPETREALTGVDVVIHLAGIAHQTAEDVDYQRANVDLPIALARLAHQAGVRRFVFISTSHVHGRWSAAPLTPDSPLSPKSPYARSKATAEVALSAYVGEVGMELVIVRPPLVYGPEAKANFAILARAAKLGLPLPLGRAKGVRSMVSLTNLIDAIIWVAVEPLPTALTILLPADPEDLPVGDMYLGLCRAAGRSAFLLPVPSTLMRSGLGAVGKAEIYDSLFRPASINRDHWRVIGWCPPQSAEAAFSAALA